MEILVTSGDIKQFEVPAVIVNVFEGTTQPGGATGVVDRALEGIISQLISEGEITGKTGEMTLIHTLGKLPPARILIAGLGKPENFTQDTVRSIMASACRYLRGLGIQNFATIAHGLGAGKLTNESVGQAIAEGALLGLYQFIKHFSKVKNNQQEIHQLYIVEENPSNIAGINSGVKRGQILADAAIVARDMINEPANIMVPTQIAEISKEIAKHGDLGIELLSRNDMEKLRMGALLGVAQGSHQPPTFIILRYKGDPEHPKNNLGLVGKGITFDSGGISLKPAQNMWEMKGDMSGAASVIGAMKAIAQIRPTINVTALAPCTENMPGGFAQRPGDIVQAMSGKSIEIDNTDAEGRLILADALCYARQMGLCRLVDVATLTGAMVVALGEQCTGSLGNHQELLDQVKQAGELAGERIWQLPLFDEYKEQIKSDVADLKNTGGRAAGAITAAQFLAEFAEDTPWVHLDIAGTFMRSKEHGYLVKGATGISVRTLVHLALNLGNLKHTETKRTN